MRNLKLILSLIVVSVLFAGTALVEAAPTRGADARGQAPRQSAQAWRSTGETHGYKSRHQRHRGNHRHYRHHHHHGHSHNRKS